MSFYSRGKGHTNSFFGNNGAAVLVTGQEYGSSELIKWGEVTSFSPSTGRWTNNPLFYIQLFMLFWYLAFAICYLIESLGGDFISNWIAFLFWSIGGGIIVLLFQTFAFVMLYRENQSDVTGSHFMANPSDAPRATSYLGAAHMKELFMAYVFSVIIYAFVFWAQIGWLVEYHPTCCEGPTISFAPIYATDNTTIINPTFAREYNDYRFSILLIVVLCLGGVVSLIRAVFTHMNPLAAVATLATKATTVTPSPSFQPSSHMMGRSLGPY